VDGDVPPIFMTILKGTALIFYLPAYLIPSYASGSVRFSSKDNCDTCGSRSLHISSLIEKLKLNRMKGSLTPIKFISKSVKLYDSHLNNPFPTGEFLDRLKEEISLIGDFEFELLDTSRSFLS